MLAAATTETGSTGALVESERPPAARAGEAPPAATTDERAPSATAGEQLPAAIAALRPLVRAVVARVLGASASEADVEDGAHEALRRALEGWSRLRLGEPVGPWVAGIARHVALDQRRARGRRREDGGERGAALLDAAADAAPTLDVALDARRRAARLDAVLDTLPEGHRAALVAFHVDGLPYQEIARNLGVPLGTVATWVARGRKKLAEALADEPVAREGVMSLREDVLDEAEIFDGEHLSEAEIFDGEHLSEVAIVLLGDGAGALVGPAGQAHAEGCGACCARVGADAALASADVHVAFAGLREAARAPLALQARAAAGAGEARSREVQGGEVQAGEVPAGDADRETWGGAWIAAGLVIAAVASAPALTGVASTVARLRDGLEVVLRVTLQVEQALRLASGRMETVRMGASWIAAVALVAVGLWIARRGPGVGKVQEEAR